VRSGLCCVIALTVALGVSACSGQSGSSDPKSSAASTSDAPSCRATAARAQWPAGVPAAVPRPAGLHVVSNQHSAGITITRFTTTESLVQLAETFRAGLPKAGFDLRGGDAEGDEVDQRFGGHGYRGALKLHGSSACRTDGTLVGTRLRQSG
jgi:hypothetical protein